MARSELFWSLGAQTKWNKGEENGEGGKITHGDSRRHYCKDDVNIGRDKRLNFFSPAVADNKLLHRREVHKFTRSRGSLYGCKRVRRIFFVKSD